MKVIQQLIAYFEERGQLTQDQVERLIEKGYWSLYTSADIRGLEGNIGRSLIIQTTGQKDGPLWGTDVYTSDSALEVACVHAGILRVGQTGLVKVTMVPPLPVFRGSTRNGVVSRDWTTSWSGAYRVELIRK
ncbi:MAG: hypothetical protein IT429_12540 [Gemmataceae bacterium]|nr:hypothetical protein [Gemmataceae bacterium]